MEAAGPAADANDSLARLKYTRAELLALRDNPKCRSLPSGLDSDDLSDLQESSFFDKTPSLDGPPIYLGPQRGPAGQRAPFGAARRPPGPPGLIHSRLIDEEERPYQRSPSGQLSSGFDSSPSKPQTIQSRSNSVRYDDPARMDRWDSRKLSGGGGGGSVDDGWQQQKSRGGDWRGGGTAGAPRGSMETARAGSGWGGRDSQPDLQRSGSSAPKDGATGSGRWVRDDDDWRARKQTGAAPEPRYDWSDNRAAAGGVGPGAAARGPPPGFHDHRERAPEWADEEPGQRARMTAADIEAERLRMQEQWKRQGGGGPGTAQATMSDLMTDEDIMSMMAEESEKQAEVDGRQDSKAANGIGSAAPKAGQHVDVAAMLGGRLQPTSPGNGGASPASATAGDRAAAESTRSRFANFFKLEESPAPGAADATGGGAAAEAKPQQLSFDDLSRATAAAADKAGAPPPMPTQHVATAAEIEHKLPTAEQALRQPAVPQQAGQSGNAGQALLAMLRQQQQAQAAAAAGGGAPPRHMLPPNAVNAADVTVLEEADKVARLTALQGLDDEVLGSPNKAAAGAAPPGMQLPPGVSVPPPPGHLPPGHVPQQQLPGGPHPPPPGMQGFPGQLPPSMHPMQHHGHMPPPPFPPGQLPPGMHPVPPGMQPPLHGMQYRPPAGLQYRPPGVGLPPQPGMQQPGMPAPQLQQQQQQQQQTNALLAQLLAAQASRGPPPQQQHQQLPQVQPGQQINLAALLGAAHNHGMQLPPVPQHALNPAQLQCMRPPAGMMPPGMPAPGPALHPGFNPALLQQLQMQQGMQRPHMPPPMQQHAPPQQQLSSAQLMAALGLAQNGMPQQGLR